MFLLERIYISGFLIGLTTFAERGEEGIGGWGGEVFFVACRFLPYSKLTIFAKRLIEWW